MIAPVPSLHVTWDGIRRADWDRLVDRATVCPFEQTWSYGSAHARSNLAAVHRAVVLRARQPVAFAQILSRRIAGLVTVAQILRGPVLLDGELSRQEVAALLVHFHGQCRIDRRQLLFWTPEVAPDEDTDAVMRRCGMRRIMTGYGSLRVDLRRDEKSLRRSLHGKWRNALVRAEAEDLRVECRSDPDAVPWLLAHYDEQRRKRRFGGPSAAMVAFILSESASSDILFVATYQGGEPVAGALFLRHGGCATYLVGWTGAVGRALNAGTLTLWRGMLECRSRELHTLDLGGIDTRREPGIARFKLGLGGAPYQIAGTFF